jgi:hypothetical protein
MASLENACGGRDHSYKNASRRDFLYVGLLGGLGLTLGDYFQEKALASNEVAIPGTTKNLKEGKAKSVIHIYLPGGISSQESFDPKSDAPVEYKGPYNAIKTNNGDFFSETLALTSKIANKICVIRSVTHSESAHERGTHNMFTGYKPSPSIKYPSFGSIVSEEFGPRKNLPAYICIPEKPNEFAGSGYLSNQYGPFSIGSDPSNKNFTVRDLELPKGVDEARFSRRRDLLSSVNNHFRTTENSDQIQTMDSFRKEAYSLLSSTEAREAFNLSKESDETKEQYGRNTAGMRFLLARRLVESGARFITTTYGGWDHHQDIKTGFSKQMPSFDKAFSSLITDLDQRGLLDSTLVVVSSEFGRTPKINKTDGRDHWPRCFSVVMAGGGIKDGIYGSSDKTGAEPYQNQVNIEQLAATIYNQIGINYEKRLIAPGNRPIDIVHSGKPIKEIIS